MNTIISKIALALSALVMAGGAMADTSTMGSTASIAAACSVGAGGTIALSSLVMLTVDGTQTALSTVAGATFPAICTNGTTLPKFAYASTNALATTDFRLKGGTTTTEYISYTMHPSLDGNLAAITGGFPTAHPDFVANGVSQSLKLSANISSGAKAEKSVQSYSDTINITVRFGV